jgi:pyridoxamine 5'-phosphate oxidase
VSATVRSGRVGDDPAAKPPTLKIAAEQANRLAAMRRIYEHSGLDEADLAADWLAQFRSWLDDAVAAGLSEPNAMILATATPDAQPTARTVLLKGLDARGFVLFTNYASRKGQQALDNPAASLVFPWHAIQRQVVVAGAIERVSDAESDAYFATRPHGAQLGALASPQSSVIGSRAELEAARDALAAQYPEGAPVPRPATWGGLRVIPETVEFWQGRPDRLHDRLRYRRLGGVDDAEWVIERLAP